MSQEHLWSGGLQQGNAALSHLGRWLTRNGVAEPLARTAIRSISTFATDAAEMINAPVPLAISGEIADRHQCAIRLHVLWPSDLPSDATKRQLTTLLHDRMAAGGPSILPIELVFLRREDTL